MFRRENLRLLGRAARRQGVHGIASLGLSWLGKRLELARVPALPSFLHVEVTNRCNLRCFTCARAAGNGGDDLSLAELESILGQVPRVAKVALYGIGEPLLNRDFLPMLREARARDCYVGFFTNCTLLHEPNVAALVEARPDYVNLSLDGATKETFERYRTGAVFEKCIEGIRRLVSACKRTAAPTNLSIYFCGTADNIHELPGMVQLAKDAGIRTVVVQDLMDWNVVQVAEALRGTSYHDGNRPLFESAFARAAEVAARTGVEVWSYASAGDGARTCRLPWYYVFITAKGQVTPCHWLGYDGSLNFGNIREQPLSRIWRSEPYRRFRQELRGSQRPRFCERCPNYDRHVRRVG